MFIIKLDKCIKSLWNHLKLKWKIIIQIYFDAMVYKKRIICCRHHSQFLSQKIIILKLMININTVDDEDHQILGSERSVKDQKSAISINNSGENQSRDDEFTGEDLKAVPIDHLSKLNQQKRLNKKLWLRKVILGLVILLAVVGIGSILQKSLKQIEKPKSRFPKTHQFHDINFKDDGHLPSFQHLHTPLKFSYPTVGIPVPGDYFNATRVADKDLKKFDQVILDLFKPYNDTDCINKRYGDENDGGYIICENFIDQAEAMLNLGIHGFDNFGCDLTSSHVMPNYQFDCTDEHQPACSTNQNNNKYENVCIGEITEKKNLYFWTLEDMIKQKNLFNKHIILKIDIDGGQYLAFRYLPAEYLDYIDQIFIEAHFDNLGREEWGYLDIYRTLAEKFVTVNFNYNNNGCFTRYSPFVPSRGLKSHAFQATMVNKKLIKVYSPTRSWKRSPLYTPNVLQLPDCQESD